MASPTGLEPATHSLGNYCSIRLSYGDTRRFSVCSTARVNRADWSHLHPNTRSFPVVALALYHVRNLVHRPGQTIHSIVVAGLGPRLSGSLFAVQGARH